MNEKPDKIVPRSRLKSTTTNDAYQSVVQRQESNRPHFVKSGTSGKIMDVTYPYLSSLSCRNSSLDDTDLTSPLKQNNLRLWCGRWYRRNVNLICSVAALISSLTLTSTWTNWGLAVRRSTASLQIYAQKFATKCSRGPITQRTRNVPLRHHAFASLCKA